MIAASLIALVHIIVALMGGLSALLCFLYIGRM